MFGNSSKPLLTYGHRAKKDFVWRLCVDAPFDRFDYADLTPAALNNYDGAAMVGNEE